MHTWLRSSLLLLGPCLAPIALAQATAGFDAELARRTGADARGMRAYVLVILRSSPTPVVDEARRQAMFAGHFANMERLAGEGKLALAGPFDRNADGWRGLFVLATDSVEQARNWTASDPVIREGEMLAEFHPWYGSAALMLIPEMHARLVPPPTP